MLPTECLDFTEDLEQFRIVELTASACQTKEGKMDEASCRSGINTEE